MDDDNTIYILNDNIGGLSVMEHNNCKSHIVVCEECEEVLRQQLIDNECWMDLDRMDNTPNMRQDYFQDYDKLVKDIEEINKVN